MAVTFKRIAAVFLVSFFLGAVFPRLGTDVAHAATVTAHVTGINDPAACAAAYHLHHVTAVPRLYADEKLWQSAYRSALLAAKDADPALSLAILHYLHTGKGFSWVAGYCVTGFAS